MAATMADGGKAESQDATYCLLASTNIYSQTKYGMRRMNFVSLDSLLHQPTTTHRQNTECEE